MGLKSLEVGRESGMAKRVETSATSGTANSAGEEPLTSMAGTRRLAFQREPEYISPRRIFDHIEPAGKRKILLAAVVAFSGRGFHATSTRDIAKLVGASPAGLYTYYDTKANLLYDMSTVVQRYVLDLIEKNYSKSNSSIENLSAIIREWLLFNIEETVVVRVVNRDFAALDVGRLAEILRLRNEAVQLLQKVIDDGINNGELRAVDSKTAANAIVRLVDVSSWDLSLWPGTRNEFANEHANLALRMLGQH